MWKDLITGEKEHAMENFCDEVKGLVRKLTDKKLDRMAESDKRCMIYWWYATNIFQLVERTNDFSYLIVLFVL